MRLSFWPTFMLFITSWFVLTLVGAQGQKPPVFRGGINIVQTDVTVLDAQGRPMRGLTMDEFSIYEDGEPLEIRGFAEVNIPDASDGPRWMREGGADVRTALDGRVFVFLLDDAQVPYLMELGAGFIHPNERIAAVKRITEQFINRMGPDDAAAVICVYDNRCDQDFTSDRTRLRAAIAKFSPKGAFKAYKVSAGMSESIARMLEGQASRRRTLIYVSPHLPTRPAVFPPPNNVWDTTTLQVLATFKAAMSSGITVYGVNPNTLLPLAQAPPDEPDASVGDTSSAPGRFSAPPRSLSAETGGFTITRPDQFVLGVEQIFRETGSYYLLGYEPPPKKDTGYNMIAGFRSLEIRVSRPGAVVKAHRGYVEAESPKTPKDPPAESTKALMGVLPKADLPVRVTAASFAVPGQSEALVAVTLGVGEPAVTSRTRDYIDVQIRAFTPQGAQRAMVRHRVDALLSPNRAGDSLTEVVSQLRLKPGAYELRVSAYSERMGTAGSVYVDLDVPDFAKAPLSLSGALLMSVPKPEAVLPEPLPPLLPVAPTSQRDFARNAIVRAHVRAYQGGKLPVAPVTMRTTILDDRSAAVVDRMETLEVERFGVSRSADVRIDVPVGQLEPGWHLLRIEATTFAATERRDVRFRVR
jgi:VWFA-related protein